MICRDVKTALVVGSGSGMGRAIALELARRGIEIFAADLDQAAAQETVQAVVSAGGCASAHGVDVARSAAVTALFATLRRRAPRLDLLVHASVIPEPFGQVVIEGMAAGLPVIAAAAGGPTEVITDGVDGVLSTPEDVDELADHLRRLANSPVERQRLGTNAVESAKAYSDTAIAGALVATYARVVSAR